METNKKIERLIQEFKREGIDTVYTKVVTYSSISKKFETECTLERYFRNEDIEDKFVETSDDKLITRLIRKLAELRLMKKEPLLLEN